MDWPNCLNVRDLGGLPTADGPVTARALIRSDNLNRLTPAGIERLHAANIGRIVDVRSATECEQYPSPFAGESLYCNRPLFNLDDAWEPTVSLASNYAVGLDRSPELFAAAVETIATSPRGGVVVHCHSGKDRSGMVIALVLSVVGVPAGVIAADYASIGDGIRADFAAQVSAVDDPDTRRQLEEELSSRPQTMFEMIAHLDNVYGGVEAYLHQGGLTHTDISRLRTRLTRPSAARGAGACSS